HQRGSRHHGRVGEASYSRRHCREARQVGRRDRRLIMAGKEKTIKVTLVKSVYGQLANIRNSVKGLGLRRIGHSVVVADTPSNRGMVKAASHMLKAEPAVGKV